MQEKLKPSNDLLHSTRTIRLLNGDSGGNNNEVLFSKEKCFLKLINTDLEISTLETYEGYILLIIGNPFLKPGHQEAIRNLIRVENKDEFMNWMQSKYDQYGFGRKESLLMRLEYTCRFVRDSEGIWRLFLPCPNYYVGGPAKPGNEIFTAASNSFGKWLQNETTELYYNG